MLINPEQPMLQAVEALFGGTDADIDPAGAATREKHGDVPQPRKESHAQTTVKQDRQLRLRLDYPGPDTARLWLIGAVDLTNTERVREAVHSRLRSQLRTLEMDLSRIDFLSIGGARMLAHAAAVAPVLETELRIRPGYSRAARVALRIMSDTEVDRAERSRAADAAGARSPTHG